VQDECDTNRHNNERKIIMQTKEIISNITAYNHTYTVHKTVHRLSCYINIPKYSKLFLRIVRKTSVRESDCPGNVRYPAAVPLSVRGSCRSPSDTMSPGPRPTSVPSGILIRPTIWPHYTNVTDRTDRATVP